jgi:acyl-CoA synthetase (AMP-forming)/AMP-acid ligase II/acyl carrier protein
VTIVDLLERRARAHPTRIAFGSPAGNALTYAEWQERSTIAAGHLAAVLTRGEPVALPFSLAAWNEYAIAYMAVAKAGGVCVPVTEGLSRAELGGVLRQVNARLLIAPGPIDVEACDQLELGGLMSLGPSLTRRRPRALEPAEILFTSGTTGPPEPVTATHANLAHPLAAPGAWATSGAIVHATAFASNAAQTMLLQPLRAGGRAVVSARWLDAPTLEEAIRRFGVSEITASPTTLMMLADSHEHDFSSIARINAVAAPSTPVSLRRVADRFAAATVVNVYTSTEAWPARTTLHFGHGPEGSVGRPRGGSDVVILGADDLPVSAREVGDVALTLPPGVPPRARLGGARETPGRTVRTGDIGFLDEDGYLYVLDRESDVVNAGGRKIYSLEVEAALAELPEVTDVAVVGLHHETLGEYAVAVVALDRPASAAELRQRLGALVAAGKQPHDLVVLPELPHNGAGKVDKRSLRELLGTRPQPSPRDRTMQAGELLRLVLDAWREVLDVHDLDRDESFFALGGNSLLAMRMVARLSVELGRELPASAFFAWTTAAEMTDVLRDILQADRSR